MGKKLKNKKKNSVSHKKNKFNKKRTRYHKSKSRSNYTRKKYGGTSSVVSFNTPVYLSDGTIPKSVYYEYNTNITPNPIDSRLLPSEIKGGKKKIKRTKRKRKKLKGGGSLIGTDLVTRVNTYNSNDVLAFNTTGGTQYMYDKLQGNPIPSGPELNIQEKMVPLV